MSETTSTRSDRGADAAATIAIDTGGTFTDVVLACNGRGYVLKLPSTPHDPARAAVAGLREILQLHGLTACTLLIHGSTVATNALLERKGANGLQHAKPSMIGGSVNVDHQALVDKGGNAVEQGHTAQTARSANQIVRFTADGPVVEGTASFAGQVMADAGAARPPAQRFGVVEGRSFEPVDPDDPAAADADVLFVRFDGDAGLAEGTEYMETDRWLDLGAVSDSRLFAVTDDVWSTPGPVAARAVLTDLKVALNGYSH